MQTKISDKFIQDLDDAEKSETILIDFEKAYSKWTSVKNNGPFEPIAPAQAQRIVADFSKKDWR